MADIFGGLFDLNDDDFDSDGFDSDELDSDGDY